MPIDWSPDERKEIDRGMRAHPVESGRCAALARVVFRVAQPRDAGAVGLQVRPASPAARFVVPKLPDPPRWGSHTLVESEEHRIDALTGTDGCAAFDYLTRHWQYPEHHKLAIVDVYSVDPGIEDKV